MAWADPYPETSHATVGDIIGVLRVGDAARANDVGFRGESIDEPIEAIEKSLERALGMIRRV